ncbi:alpha/beta hydrolase [Thermostichus vulcanus]|uniref:Alpha/beta hydrolase n=1 Tax=Thermostichus vulcanus str. 'Rupite' TaxID=2813851 RepID=A0ABT0CF94_THEVL|nr:alpha/beta hydrolase [Thermostichus vulcanus]MCJ2544459.1 alpha/beta hydrolase [Thermostichus vulcanus str. 'Rupite']
MNWPRGLLALGLGLGTVFSGLSQVWGAERLAVFLPPLIEVSLPVEDLAQFAETGTVSRRLDFYLRRLNPEQQAALADLLTRDFNLNPVTVSQFTYSSIGEDLLRRLTLVLHSAGEGEAEFYALRAALIRAAGDPGGFTLVNILRHYPLEKLRIDLDMSIRVVREASQLFRQRDLVIAGLRQEATQEAQSSSLAFSNSVSQNLAQPRLDPEAVGAFEWQMESFQFDHPWRDTPVPVDVYLPERMGRIPLVVVSHGIASDRNTFAYLARHWASRGIGVAVLEHPGTSVERVRNFLSGFGSLPGPYEWVARPEDISSLLDELELKAQQDPSRWGRLDLQSVGLFGQSLGGYTVLATAGASLNPTRLQEDCQTSNSLGLTLNASLLLQCRANEVFQDPALAAQAEQLVDERIQAVFALNPLTSTVFGPEGLGQVGIPVMIMAGSEDYFAPSLPEQIEPFTWLGSQQRYLVMVEGSTHFTFLGGGGQGAFPVPQELIGPDPQAARPLLKGLTTAFFRTYLQAEADSEDYAAYLNSSYAEALTPDPLRTTLIRELTEEQIQLALNP